MKLGPKATGYYQGQGLSLWSQSFLFESYFTFLGNSSLPRCFSCLHTFRVNVIFQI